MINSSLGIHIDPAPSDTQDFADYAQWTMDYAQWTMSHWVATINHFDGYLDDKERLNRAITNLKAYIEKEKQNKHYKFHTVTYVGFPLDLSDYTVQNFAPFFMLSVNYGAKESCVTNFLIK